MSVVEQIARVLIIGDPLDDRGLLLETIKKVVGRQCECTRVVSVSAGIEQLAEGQDWDCVFLEYSPFDSTGLEVLSQVKSTPACLATPVVVIAGQGSSRNAVEAMKIGAFDYWLKEDISPGVISRILFEVQSKDSPDQKTDCPTSERPVGEDYLYRINKTFKDSVNNMQIGFALHEIVLDEAGTPVDYIFLEMNEAFEKQTSLKRDDLVGRRVTEVLPGIEHDKANWIGRYGEVVQTGITTSFENYSEALNKWFSIVAYKPDEGQFGVIFHEITNFKQAEQSIDERTNELLALNQELSAANQELETQFEELTATNQIVLDSQAALKDSEERHRYLYVKTPAMLHSIDSKGNIISVSNMWVEQMGYLPEEVIGHPSTDFLTAESRKFAKEKVLPQFFKTGHCNNIPYQFVKKDGEIIDVLLSAIAERDANGNVVRSLAVVTDVTKRKKAEDELNESEKRFMEVFHSTSDALLLIDGETFVDCNVAVISMLGYSDRKEFLNTHPSELSPTTQPDGRDSFEKAADMMQQAMEKGFHRFEWMHRKADGTDFSVEVTLVMVIHRGKRILHCLWRDLTESKQAEAKLRLSEEKFSKAFLASPDALGITRLTDGLIIEVNEGFETTVGITRDNAIGKTTIELDLWAEIEKRNEINALISENGFVRDFSCPFARASGDVFDGIFSAETIEIEGEPCIVWIVKDVTQAKLDAEQITAEHARFIAVMDSLDALVYAADMDTYELLYMNAHGRNIWGDHIGEKCYGVLQAGQSDRCSFCTNDKLLDESGNPIEPLVWEFKNTIDNQWYQCRDQAIRWPDGRLVRLEVATNITERKLVEEAQIDSKALLEESQRIGRLGSYVLDVSNGTWSSSDVLNSIFGIPPDYHKDVASWVAIVHPEDRENLQDHLSLDVLTHHRPFDKTYRVVRLSDGAERWVHGYGKLKFSQTGKPLQMIGTIQDITEQKQAEADRLSLERQVLQAQKLESLGIMAGGIAHDFNNLLMVIMGNADLALDGLSPHAPARQNISEIESAAKRAAGLAKQMLAYSGKGKFEVEVIDLNEFVAEMSHLLEVSISKKAVMKYNYADNLPSFKGDATQVRQIIMNLIINASEAVGETSGVVSLSTGMMDCTREYLDSTNHAMITGQDEVLPEGGYVYIEVSDTGCGMDTETIEKIFDPFFTTKFTGRGLGLAAVQGIVRGHSGAMKIYSEVGKGTTFKVLFPIQKDASNTSQKSLIKKQPKWSKDYTILIADDEESILAVGKMMLNRLGFKVLTASDGLEAVEMFKKHQDEIDGVLLDLTMPHKDGHEVFRDICAIRKGVKVLLCSGFNEQEATQAFAGKGLSGFIHKPYTTKDLLAKLHQVLEG